MGVMIQIMFLVAAILAVRKMFGEKLHAYVRYSLWLLVVFRLLVPVNLFDSPVSILRGVENMSEWYLERMVENSPVIDRQNDSILSAVGGEQVFDVYRDGSAEEEQNTAGQWDAEEKQDVMKRQGVDEEQDGGERQDVGELQVNHTEMLYNGTEGSESGKMFHDWWEDKSAVVRTVWLLGSLLAGSLFTISYLHFRRRLYKSRQLTCILPSGNTTDAAYFCQSKDSAFDGRRGYKGEIPVYLVKGLESPCLVGIFRPAVYMGTDVDLDSDTFRYALAHEKVHYLHKDHLWAVLRAVLVIVYWFHPFVWMAAAASARDGEIACDYGTIQRIGAKERFAYGEMLLAFSRSTKGKRLYSYGTMLQPGKSELKERILRLTEAKGMRRWAGILTILLMLVLAGCAFTGASADGSEAQENSVLADGSGNPENSVLTESIAGSLDTENADNQTAQSSDGGQESQNSQNGKDNAAVENIGSDDNQGENQKDSTGEFGEIEAKAAVISAETPFGADGPSLDFAGKLGTGKESIVIFHDYFGLIVYDLTSEKVIRSLDLMSIGCHMTQGDDACQVAVSEEGTTVWLHPRSKRYMYRYEVEKGRLYREELVKTFEIDLEGEDLFDRYLVSEDAPQKYMEWQSNYLYEEYKDERGLQTTYIYLYTSHGEEQKLGSMKLVWSDMVFILKWEDQAEKTEGFPLRYEGAVVDIKILYDKPCNYLRISDAFGGRVHPVTQEMVMHEGIDFAAKEGTDITAAADGVVYETGFSEVYGNYVVLLHVNGDMTYYCHCRKVIVKKDDQVKRGQKIATVGTTGQSTGPHLHFALSRHGGFVDPAEDMQNVVELDEADQ